ncbi:MAG: T9SS type A sorting domain-containing protein [Candidatus Kapaibacterium sp.]
MKKITLMLAAVICMFFGMKDAGAKPRIIIGDNPIRLLPESIIIQRVILNVNNLSAYFQNTGIFDQNTTSNNSPGLEWSKGSGRYANFTAGLCIGCGINGQYAQVMASYKGEYAPGMFQNNVWTTNADFKMYTVRMGDNASNNPDYANWYKMVPYGAPYKDVNNNGVYDDGIDIPGMPNASQTIFECMGDGDPSQRSPGEGFGGGITSPLLGAEIHFISWAYSTPGIEDVQFISYTIINKGTARWDSTFTGIVADPDLGDALDDYIGCDTLLNLGYCYNADNNDGSGSPPTYGASPPAFGMDYFRSPINKVTGDTLGITSFLFFTSTSSMPPPCESDPNGEPVPAYHYLQGMKKDRTPFMDITNTPPKRTKFAYSGDPETGVGWTEYKGSMQNCNGDTTGMIFSVNPPGDRRMVFNSGALDFAVNPGDTQRIVLSQFVQRGSDNKNSVTMLKRLSMVAQLLYDNNFNVNLLPTIPVVSQSVTPINSTQCSVNLFWDDAAEAYNYWDTIFYQKSDSNIYKFEGYEIYEVDKNLPNYNLPDFSRPLTIDPSRIKLLNIYDLRNNIGLVIDTLPIAIVNNQEIYGPMPIVPPYGMTTPPSFPNSGLSRSIKITNTMFPGNYGGTSQIQYGQTYKFVVNAYSVSTSTKIRRGFKVLRNPMNSVILSVTPQPYSNNISFTYYNGDTLSNSLVDLGLTPVVVGQQMLQTAKYRIVYTPDTTYSIQKSVNNGASYTTLKTGLRPTGFRTLTHEDSRIYDGIFFKVDKIRFSGNPPNYLGNAGLIRDPASNLPADSIQTRYKGWAWSNQGNQFLTGSKYIRDPSRPWQSVSMSLSYPITGTFTNLRSALTADKLRKVTIQWTSLGQGQYAYWYQDTSKINDNYSIFRGIKQVPFKVFVDSLVIDNPSIPTYRYDRRQVNCAFLESSDINPFTNSWNPTTDSLGGKLLLYTFGTSYDTNITTPYKNRNLFIQQPQFDIMFVWAPRLVSSGGAGQPGEEFYIYPYNATRGYYNGTAPLIYEFSTTAPVVPVINISTEVPEKYDLLQNYPNPFNPVTNIRFKLPERAYVTIKIYNVLGQHVKTLVNNERLDAGTHQTRFSADGLASGIYFYTIQTEMFMQTKRMVLVR